VPYEGGREDLERILWGGGSCGKNFRVVEKINSLPKESFLRELIFSTTLNGLSTTS
jgi:hypothetical protein